MITPIVSYLVLAFAIVAAMFAFLAFLGSRRPRSDSFPALDQIGQVIRNEIDRVRSEHAEQSRALRQELSDSARGFQDSTLGAFRQLGEQLGEPIKDFGGRLDTGINAVCERATEIKDGLHLGLTQMRDAGDDRHRALVEVIDAKLNELTKATTDASQALRSELGENFKNLGAATNETLRQLGEHQKERLDTVTLALAALTERIRTAQEELRKSVEDKLEKIRTENSTKLDEMRQTVDEKLQTALEKRLGESFRLVSEQLQRVHEGLGEMQNLAADVGNLRNVLTNVKVRGTWGEIQLGNLLEQFLSPEQYMRGAQVKEGSQERIEFAIRLPGRGDEGEVLLPINSKFPQEDYQRLTLAAENGDAAGVEQASQALEARVRLSAKILREKYINPPRTTEFAVLFLPTESLYAELLRRPGFFEQLQLDHHVTLAGPTTLTAILNALQMGFKSLAIEKRSSEVWRILGAVRTEFSKYGSVVSKLRKQLDTAVNTIDDLGTRTRVMGRTLKDVEVLPEGAAQSLLGLDKPKYGVDDTEEAHLEPAS